jgi:hypothetical protein
MDDKSNLKPKHGIVSMIDALGVRNSTIQESIHFIENIQSIVEAVPAFISGYVETVGKEKKKKFEAEPPELITFGDTIVFSWQMKPEETSNFLTDVGFFLSFIIVAGLQNKMAFRGSVSVGDYIQSGSTVLGPAVADVAAWYDSSEMIGILATPFCGQLLNSINEIQSLNSMDFIKYAVPLKGGDSKDLWTVGWPEHLDYLYQTSKITPLQNYYNLIQNFAIPKGVEDKFFNTEKFVKSVLSDKTK